MAYRELDIVDVREILRRLAGGEKVKQVARSLGLCPKTVRRYRNEARARGLLTSPATPSDTEIAAIVAAGRGVPASPPPPPSDQLLLPCRERIAEWIDKRYRLTTIRKLLRDEVDVAYPTLRRFAVKHCGFGAAHNTVRLSDARPGAEAQVDWGVLGRLFDQETGRMRQLKVLVVTLSHSRHMYLHVSFEAKTPNLIRGLEAAWEFFGGVTARVIIDNQKPAVTRADLFNPLENKTFLEYSQFRDFIIDPTRGAHPEGNARTERNVQYVREAFFRGETFRDIGEVQARAVRWCLETAGTRRHGTTGRAPLAVFESEEKPVLKPLSGERFDIPSWGEAKVHRDHHIQFLKALYTVPTRYIGRRVTVRGDSALVKIYCGGELIKVHPRQKAYGRATDFDDYPKEKTAYAMRNPLFCIESAGRFGTASREFCEKLLSGEFPWAKLRQAQKLIRLGEKFGAERLDEAARRAVAFDLINVHRLEAMLLRALPPEDPRRKGNRVVRLPTRFAREPESFSSRKEKENGDISGPVEASETPSALGDGGDHARADDLREAAKAGVH